ncbi:MAG: response regulator [Fretibacterium sp.]|nr:response regulator [Fretibacterium sp.]
MNSSLLRVACRYDVWLEVSMLPFLFILVVFLSFRYAVKAEVNRCFRILAFSTLIAAILGIASTLAVDGWGKTAVPPILNLLLRSFYFAAVNVNSYLLMCYIAFYVGATDRIWFLVNRGILFLSFAMLALNLMPGWGGFFFDKSFVPGETALLKGPFYLFCRPIYGIYFMSLAFYLQVTHRKNYNTLGQYLMMSVLWALLLVVFIVQNFLVREMLLTYVAETLLLFATFFCNEAPAYQQMVKSENELRNASVEAEVFTKFAESSRRAKGNFLANTSHEIRTPMNAILGMNEMILKENRDEEVRRAALNIRRAGNSLLSTINNILDISRLESGKMEIYRDEYHLWQLLLDVSDSVFENLHEKGLDFVLDVDKSLPEHLYGDEDRLRQIITNLVDNAVKYTEQGSVTLGVHGEREESRVNLVISIRDTGIGIREEDLELLFRTFTRVNLDETQNIQGAGLGLVLVRCLLDMMDGRITVESEYGKGTTFKIFLMQPLAKSGFQGTIQEYEERAQKELAFLKDEGPFTCPGAHLLIVDDTPVNLVVARGMLSSTEACVDTAESGEECLELMKETHYNIIFLDHRMPGMDGIETLDRAKKLEGGQDVVYIALTANSGAGFRDEYIGYGFDDYLPKPIKSDALHRILTYYLPEDLKIKGPAVTL